MTKHKVLSTKKLDLSLIEKAKEIDIDIVCHDFISVKPSLSLEKFNAISTGLEDAFIVFTSSNAVEIVAKQFEQTNFSYAGWKVFSLSGKTTESILKYFPHIKVIDVADNAASLAKKIIEHNIKNVVFFCGNKRRDELPHLLSAAGVKIEEIEVYTTHETPFSIQEKIDGVLFFSPSAVRSFFAANKINSDTICFAVGQTTAESIRLFVENKIITSKETSQQSVLSSVLTYFQNINCYE